MVAAFCVHSEHRAEAAKNGQHASIALDGAAAAAVAAAVVIVDHHHLCGVGGWKTETQSEPPFLPGETPLTYAALIRPAYRTEDETYCIVILCNGGSLGRSPLVTP